MVPICKVSADLLGKTYAYRGETGYHEEQMWFSDSLGHTTSLGKVLAKSEIFDFYSTYCRIVPENIVVR